MLSVDVTNVCELGSIYKYLARSGDSAEALHSLGVKGEE